MSQDRAAIADELMNANACCLDFGFSRRLRTLLQSKGLGPLDPVVLGSIMQWCWAIPVSIAGVEFRHARNRRRATESTSWTQFCATYVNEELRLRTKAALVLKVFDDSTFTSVHVTSHTYPFLLLLWLLGNTHASVLQQAQRSAVNTRRHCLHITSHHVAYLRAVIRHSHSSEDHGQRWFQGVGSCFFFFNQGRCRTPPPGSSTHGFARIRNKPNKHASNAASLIMYVMNCFRQAARDSAVALAKRVGWPQQRSAIVPSDGFAWPAGVPKRCMSVFELHRADFCHDAKASGRVVLLASKSTHQDIKQAFRQLPQERIDHYAARSSFIRLQVGEVRRQRRSHRRAHRRQPLTDRVAFVRLGFHVPQDG